MPGMDQMLLLRQLYGGDALLTTALLIGVFLVVLWKRQEIASPALFRWGVMFFALSIALPPFMLPLATYISGSGSPRGLRGGSGESFVIMLLMNGTGPVLQALTVLCVFNAIMPRIFNKPKPIVPQKHPLDD